MECVTMWTMEFTLMDGNTTEVHNMPETTPHLTFLDYPCTVHFSRYLVNGQLAILLKHALEGDPVATATVMVEGVLTEYEVKNGYTCIKDYSENEGMLSALLEAGIVSDPIRYEATGFVTVPVVQVLSVPAHAT